MNDEAGTLIDEAQSPQQRVFFRLGGQAGLRREETASVTTNNRTSSAHKYAQKHRGGWDPRYHAVPWGGATTHRRRERQIVLVFRKLISCPSRWTFDVSATAVVTDSNTVTVYLGVS